jgi:hypothetical protein
MAARLRRRHLQQAGANLTYVKQYTSASERIASLRELIDSETPARTQRQRQSKTG